MNTKICIAGLNRRAGYATEYSVGILRTSGAPNLQFCHSEIVASHQEMARTDFFCEDVIFVTGVVLFVHFLFSGLVRTSSVLFITPKW